MVEIHNGQVCGKILQMSIWLNQIIRFKRALCPQIIKFSTVGSKNICSRNVFILHCSIQSFLIFGYWKKKNQWSTSMPISMSIICFLAKMWFSQILWTIRCPYRNSGSCDVIHTLYKSSSKVIPENQKVKWLFDSLPISHFIINA